MGDAATDSIFPPLSLTSLRLRDFRCFPTLSCALGGGITLFTGDNAQGKTSILEAVCVLLRLQSPRTSTGKELARFGTDGFGVAGTFEEHELTHTTRGAEKKLLIDGEPALTDLEIMSTIVVLIIGGSETTRSTGIRWARCRSGCRWMVLPGVKLCRSRNTTDSSVP